MTSATPRRRDDDATMTQKNAGKSPNNASATTGVRKAQPRRHLRDLREANERLVLEALRASTSEDDLRVTAEFRERLIGIIGHDLRSPLNAILMAAGLLVAGDHLTDTEAQLAGRILDSGRRMKRIIAQLLDFTHARLGGGFETNLTLVDLAPLCEQIASELRLGAKAHIDVDVRGDVTGMWDVALLGETISNLCANAVEHAKPGTPVAIDVHDAGGGAVVVAVTNFGAPIPEETMQTMFEPFRQGTEMTRTGHLGLGLYIAREVVRSHGGSLEVESRDGSTTFTIRLPRRP
jgi:signal transduction histidine kinase